MQILNIFYHTMVYAASFHTALHFILDFDILIFSYVGTMVEQWLRCCATNWKVAGLIPDGVIGIFHRHNLSDCTLALGSTQPLTEMSTRRISSA